MNCIYCRKAGSAMGAAHVFPEAVVQNSHTLPLGVCDKCNNYFSRDIDPVLLTHPIIAYSVQMLGLPGKSGKARQELGGVKRSSDGSYVEFPWVDSHTSTDSTGSKTTHVSVEASFHFNDSYFSRALHHIAFNALALTQGVEAAMDRKYDHVRQYVRFAKKGVVWPYGVYSKGLEPIRKTVRIENLPAAPGQTVRLVIFQLDLYVDLLNTGKLETWIRSDFPTAWFGTSIPKHPERKPKSRLQIVLDGSQPGEPVNDGRSATPER